jgi:large conductance mechanosensitive channel
MPEKKGLIAEFTEFIAKGNVIDLAVALIIGSAFTAIVTALVNNIIMPLIGMIIGGINFSGLVITIGTAQLAYGSFIQAVVNFLLIALVIFFMVKIIDSVQRNKKPAAKKPSEEALLLTEIRDLLAKK